MTVFTKHTIRLREGDWEAIRNAFPRQHAATIIRMLTSKFVDTRINAPLSEEELQALREIEDE